MTEETRRERLNKIYAEVVKMDAAETGKPEKIRNTEGRRKRLLKYMHYCHILRLSGSTAIDLDKENARAREYIDRVNKLAGERERKREYIKLELVNSHTGSWYIARYYYEKCSKLLCQMMVTIMDFILQSEAGRSVTYTEEERRNSLDLKDEIQALTTQFTDSYYFMCAYDYCTMKAAEYAGIGEYELLVPEHIRLTLNGLPARLCRMAADSGLEIELAEEVKNPEIMYIENHLERIYAEIIKSYGNDMDDAMHAYENVVTTLDYGYAVKMKWGDKADARLFDMEGTVGAGEHKAAAE